MARHSTSGMRRDLVHATGRCSTDSLGRGLPEQLSVRDLLNRRASGAVANIGRSLLFWYSQVRYRV